MTLKDQLEKLTEEYPLVLHTDAGRTFSTVRRMKAERTMGIRHVHQRRKGSAEEPYINHLLEVASLVAQATHGKDPDLVIAALLHDAVEDQEVPYELIVREFGKK
jgi:(p)ppGpp synthase/HD superfamily hydrolase